MNDKEKVETLFGYFLDQLGRLKVHVPAIVFCYHGGDKHELLMLHEDSETGLALGEVITTAIESFGGQTAFDSKINIEVKPRRRKCISAPDIKWPSSKQ